MLRLERGIDFDRLEPRNVAVGPRGNGMEQYDAVQLRCLSHSGAFYLTRWLQSISVPTVSPHQVVAACGDKMLTTTLLLEAGVSSPHTVVAFRPEMALRAIEDAGYPVVLEPLVGSWGRVVARVNDRDAAEAILEHKSSLVGYLHGIFYIQEYVDKPGRDIRVVVVGDSTLYFVYRRCEHWITNTALGGKAEPRALTPELSE